MFPKNRRVESQSTINEVKKMSCILCGATSNIDAHHLKSRGSGGGDEFFNLLPVCRAHHSLIHSQGLIRLAEGNPVVMIELNRRGWYVKTLSDEIGRAHV